ncbi:MAG: TIGR00725 family protein [Proteobacteria bacterium]|nr:TIGR00725 family protein [Pseudomonadota bacterium]
MTSQPRISVIGAGECDDAVRASAHRLGELNAARGWKLVCGGRGGVMQAVCQGARDAGGQTIGILPGLDQGDANPYIETAVVTGLGQMRNLLVVMNGDLVIALEGGYGTLSEVALALKAERTVIAMGTWKVIPGVIPASGPEEAVQLATRDLKQSA